MPKYTRPFLITLALAAVVGVGLFFWNRRPAEQNPADAKIAQLESLLRTEKERAARFEAQAHAAESAAAQARARADSLEKHRKTVYIVKHEKIRRSPDVGPDSLNRYFTAHTSIYSDTTSGSNTP
jgi:hypothetical protein